MSQQAKQRVNYRLTTMQEFLDILKLEMAGALALNVNGNAMDEVMSLMWQQSPEMVGDLYNLYQDEGYQAFSQAVTKRYGEEAMAVEPVQPSYRQSLIAWFYERVPAVPMHV